MARITKPLTVTQCDSHKYVEGANPEIFDGNGLILRAYPTGKKTWRYKFKWHGKYEILTIGNYPAIKLKEARDKRAEYEALREKGINPKQQQQSLKYNPLSERTFEKIARAWLNDCKRRRAFSDGRANKLLRQLINYVFPTLGGYSIEIIKAQHITPVVSSIDAKGFTDTALEVRSTIRRIFAFASDIGYIDVNPAWDAARAIKPQKTKNHPALPFIHFKDFLYRLTDENSGLTQTTVLCIYFSLHVFCRSSEIRFARWDEFDFQNEMWTIPAVRTPVKGIPYSDRGAKMKREHIVPLTPSVIQILKELKKLNGNCPYVFPSEHNKNKFVSENTVNKALRKLGYDTEVDICAHGFRTMACSALYQSGLFNGDAIEKQMSHIEQNEVKKAYTGLVQYMDERIKIMNWWSAYIEAHFLITISPYEYGDLLKNPNQEKYVDILNILDDSSIGHYQGKPIPKEFDENDIDDILALQKKRKIV